MVEFRGTHAKSGPGKILFKLLGSSYLSFWSSPVSRPSPAFPPAIPSVSDPVLHSKKSSFEPSSNVPFIREAFLAPPAQPSILSGLL